MDRLACVDVAELPLQILLRRTPDWRDEPVVVVDEDRPQGVILWANERARQQRVVPGLRYATALSLVRGLRASVVPPEAVGAVVAALVRVLRQLTPNVEPSLEEPGIFWLDATGLALLHATLGAWAEAVCEALGAEGFHASVAVGFSRFGTYAAARSGSGVTVFEAAPREREAVARVPLSRLGLAPRARERLERLGVQTVGELVALPAAGLLKRYGEEIHGLYRLARGELFAPLTPAVMIAPAVARERLDDFAERDAHRLLFRLKRLLDGLAKVVGERQAVIAELRLRLRIEGGAGASSQQEHRFRPAAPTLDTPLLLDLVRLRLESADLGLGVVEVELSAQDVPATPEQLRLFALAPRRDQAAAERALARVRAELGDGAVGCYAERSGHLPKARFAWIPVERLRPPRRIPTPPARREVGEGARDERGAFVVERPQERSLVRRMLPRPEALPSRPQEFRNDGWQPRDARQGPIVAVWGPYVVSGGWWQAEVHREYAFARTLRGDVLWVFYDRRRRRWFEQGRVE